MAADDKGTGPVPNPDPEPDPQAALHALVGEGRVEQYEVPKTNAKGEVVAIMTVTRNIDTGKHHVAQKTDAPADGGAK